MFTEHKAYMAYGNVSTTTPHVFMGTNLHEMNTIDQQFLESHKAREHTELRFDL